MTESETAFKVGRSQACLRRRIARRLAMVSLGLVINGLLAGVTAIPAVIAGAASSINSNKPCAQAQLLQRSNLPTRWTDSDEVWVGTRADDDASSVSALTMTQVSDLSTSSGNPLALSGIAAEASSPY